MLTAANPEIADSQAPSFPAVVNHVVYFGDGISTKTVLRGFRITGANNFTTGSGEQLANRIRRHAQDAVLLSRRRRHQDLCARPIRRSSASRWSATTPAHAAPAYRSSTSASRRTPRLFRNCIFRDNRTQITGAAFDLLHGSRATLENCLFVGNIANLGVDYVGLLTGGEYHPEHGSGAMTVFEGSRAEVSRCTFTGNWAGVDDNGTGSTYVEVDLLEEHAEGRDLAGRALRDRHHRRRGRARDRSSTATSTTCAGRSTASSNTFDPPDPRFDAQFVPQAPEYARPWATGRCKLQRAERAQGRAGSFARRRLYGSRTSIDRIDLDRRSARSASCRTATSPRCCRPPRLSPSPKYSGYRLCDR